MGLHFSDQGALLGAFLGLVQWGNLGRGRRPGGRLATGRSFLSSLHRNDTSNVFFLAFDDGDAHHNYR